jgi:nickel-dependent lactate racemase
MIVKVAYGKTGLDILLDDEWDVVVVEPRFIPGLPDTVSSIKSALEKPIHSMPLSKLVKPGDKVGIIFNDITRATPNQLLIQAIIDVLSIHDVDITLFDALGTHRRNTELELLSLLGTELVSKYRIVQNNAFDETTQEYVGKTNAGNEIWINKELAAMDVKILTGFIEPSDIAGFSGGGKAIMPGMAGLKTILNNHSAIKIGHENTGWGRTHGNPLWEEINEIAHGVGPVFLLNISLNRDHEVTGVFAGALDQAHAMGCEFVRKSAMVPIDERFDIVVTSNSGYPLDLNLYQCIKGMGAASQIVKQGGAIVVIAECWDGIPEHGLYKQLMQEGGSPEGVLQLIRQPSFPKLDQWSAQLQAQIQLKADVYIHSGQLSEDQIASVLLKPATSVEKTLADLVRKYGKNAKICILPEGPQTVPYIQG